ncbi:MAG: tetratricopeptide repeat protein [Desulfobacterales bacterium]|jgi:Tfp pilus assembly protein PilF
MIAMSLGILLPILSLIGFIIFIIVLIKQFKHGGALQGIIGIITCGLWTFIWGWIKHRSLAMTKIMVLWTVIELTPIAVVGVFGVAMIGQMTQMAGDLAGNPSLFMKQEQNKAVSPQLNKKATPIRVLQRDAKTAPPEKDVDWSAKAMELWKEVKYTNPNLAKNYWDKSIAANPKNAEAYNNRGLALYNLKLYQQAIADFSQALRINPQYAEAFNNRGNAYYQMDQYEKAEADFNQSLQLKPRYSKAHLNRGLVYFQMQKLEKSCEDFRRACDLGECDGLQWTMQNGFCK